MRSMVAVATVVITEGGPKFCSLIDPWITDYPPITVPTEIDASGEVLLGQVLILLSCVNSVPVIVGGVFQIFPLTKLFVRFRDNSAASQIVHKSKRKYSVSFSPQNRKNKPRSKFGGE